MREKIRKRDLLVITWNGKERNPHLYVQDETPDYDIIVFDFTGSDVSENYLSEELISRKTGGKSEIFSVLADYFRLNSIKYEYIAIFDDDVEFKSSQINTCFALGRKLNLSSFAPSLTRDSYFSWENTRNVANRTWIAVDCVELMVPFYRFGLFMACAPFYPESISGYGLDRFVMSMMQQVRALKGAGVIHAVAVRHVRPVTSNRKTYANGRTAWQERVHIRRVALNYVAENHPEEIGKSWFLRCYADLAGPARFWGLRLTWPWLALRCATSQRAMRARQRLLGAAQRSN